MTNQAYKIVTDNSPFGQFAVIAIENCNCLYYYCLETDSFVKSTAVDVSTVDMFVDLYYDYYLDCINANIDFYWDLVRRIY